MLTTYLFEKGRAVKTGLSRAEMLQALHHSNDHLLWVDLESANDFENDLLVEIFNFHPLAVEDCINDNSQPKVDYYDDYLFLVVHGIDAKSPETLKTVELDIFLGKNFVVTYHHDFLRSIDAMRTYFDQNKENYVCRTADLLVYGILDRLVEHYQPALDAYEKKIDELEEAVFSHPATDFLSSILSIKRDVFDLKRGLAPQRDTMNALARNPSQFITGENQMYFRDVFDHLYRLYGTVEGFHESISSILQVYFSYSSNRLNEIMKRLTVLATLTMPTVIIASIYGMNFKFMPELQWEHGYLGAIGLMALTSSGLLVWMKAKKWI